MTDYSPSLGSRFSRFVPFVRAISALLVLPLLSRADTLSLTQAVSTGLENNFAIRIARNDVRKADNTRLRKTGALLPTASASASATTTNTDYGTTRGGTPGLSPDGTVTTWSAGANLNWTLFDGFRMFYALEQVEQQAQLAETRGRHEIESAVMEMITAYYNLVSTRSLLEAAREQLDVSRRRLQRARAQYEYGRAGSRELLRLEVYRNTDSSAVSARELDVTRAIHGLNSALGRRPDEPIAAEPDTVVAPPEHDAAWWYESARRHNAGLSIARIQVNIAESQRAIARAAFWPVLAANGSISQTGGDNEYLRRSVGLNLSVPLFNGFRTVTSARNAVLDHENAELSHEQEQRRLRALIYEQWAILNNAYRQVSFEREAVEVARASLRLSEEQYRLGGIPEVEFRDSWLALTNARVRLESALFRCKVASRQLQQLGGVLKLDGGAL